MAYRKLALRYHPDRSWNDPHAEDRFRQINEAYDVLSHRDKRNQYDLGCDPLTGGSPFGPSYFYPWSDPFEARFLSGFRCRGGGFGRGLGSKRRVFRGTGARPAGFGSYRSDLRIHDLLLTSDEAFEGTERDIRLHTGRDTLVFKLRRKSDSFVKEPQKGKAFLCVVLKAESWKEGWKSGLRGSSSVMGKGGNPKQFIWWAMRDSNARPLVPETNALST
jgi:curved DNA-binding protein CbpA